MALYQISVYNLFFTNLT